MRRKYSPAHNFWHRRVEGQIRNCMYCHPKWFNFKDQYDKADCINSLAKRIVGEIVAVSLMATVATKDEPTACASSNKSDLGSSLKSDGGDMAAKTVSPPKFKWKWPWKLVTFITMK